MTCLRIGGRWLQRGISDLEWSERAQGGCFEASWNMALLTNDRPRQIRNGAMVEVMQGAVRKWYGVLTETDWPNGSFKAEGYCRAAEKTSALTAARATTTIPDVAVDAAIARGWPVTRLGSVGSTALNATGSTDGLNSIADVLDISALEAGARWGIWADGIIRRTFDPTRPSVVLRHDTVDLGSASDEFATAVNLRYIDSGAGNAYRTAEAIEADDDIRKRFAPNGDVEFNEDITSLGAMTETRAKGLAARVLAGSRGRLGWTQAIEVSYGQLTRGGVAADLSSVHAGEMMRIHGVYDDTRSLTGASYLDVIVGETKLSEEGRALTLTPVGTAQRTLASVLEAALSSKSGLRS